MKTRLLFLSLLISFFVNAQTLYWVGGSGNWSDSNHWSLESGGRPSGIAPSSATNLIFDDKSSVLKCIVNIVGINQLKSLKCISTSKEIHFTGDKFSGLNCFGDFLLNEKTFYEASSGLTFLSNSTSDKNVNFWKNTIDADVTFEDGSWNLIYVKVGDNNLLKFNKGKYSINNTSLISGNFEAKSGQVNFSSIHSTFHVKNKLILGKNVTFNSNDLKFIANPKIPELFIVDSQVNFGSNAKIISRAPLACDITYAFTSPSCAGFCNATITINFPGCTAGNYGMDFNTLASCVPTGTRIPVTLPTTYTLGGLCQCAGNLLDIFLYDNLGNFVAQLPGQNMPGVTTQINNSFTSPIDPTCFGSSNGSFKSTLSGGNGPYSVTVTPGSSTFTTNPFTANTISGLSAGTYTLNVKDNNGCPRSFTTSVSQPTAIAINGSSSNILCNGACTGSAAVAPTGGTPPYTYSWTSGVPTNTNTTSSLCVGMVTATVVDSKTCSVTYTTNITATPSITLTISTRSITCSGIPTGAATITATGGQAPFTYSINGVATSSVSSALSAGNYTASVKDFLGCLSSKAFTISTPPTFTTAPTQNSITCNGAATATINLNPSGGTPAYSYTWSPAAASSSINANVVAGVYSYTVGDANGCRISNSVTITQPPSTTLTVSQTSITCNGATNGSATLTPTGGTSPFNYTWTPAPTGQGTATITNLSAQSYTANVRDANGCSTSTVVTITQPSSVTISATTVQPQCNGGSNGSITISATNGSGVYTYSLQSSSSTVAGGPIFSGLSAGTYTAIVNSGVGCTSTKTVTLGQPSVLTLTLSATPLSCFSQTTSVVTSTVGGGTPTFTINWSTGALNTTSLTGQGASVITATVTDARSCTAVRTITITAPTAMTVTAIASTSLACSSSTNAIATATAIGGTPSYTYTWSNGVVNSTNSNLGSGIFTVTAKDANNCTQTQTVNIIAPLATTLTVTKTNLSCNGLPTGSATITPTGGTPPFSYTWSPVPTGQGTATISSLSAQTYTANVKDVNGCPTSTVVTINAPTSVTISIATGQPKCKGASNGTATVTATGGSGVYTYTLQSSSSTLAGGPSFSGLSAGSYTVIVNSGVGCNSTNTFTLSEPNVLTLTLSATPISCFSQSTSIVTSTVGGGTPTYSINWSTGALNTTSLTGQGASVITATVTDVNNCSAVKTLTVNAPTAMTVTAIAQTTLACFTSTNAIATATAIGGTPSYTYTWSNGVVNSTNSNLGPGTYTVTAKDVNNCTQTQTISIIAPPALTLTASNGTVGCAGVCNGTVGISAAGGTPGYTYSWNSIPAQSTAITSATLCTGSYTATVTDNNGCAKTAVATVSLPTPISIAVSGIKASCNLCIGAATVTPSGGSSPYTYTWTNSASAVVSNTNSASNLCVGTYTVKVVDTKSCSATQTVTILPSLSVVLTTTNNAIQCNNGLTGIATVSVTSGTSPYTYSWSPTGPPTQTVQTATGLGAGTYSALVTDALGCSNTATVNFANPPATTLTISKTDETCFGLSNGSATVTALGGTGAHTYTWLPGGQTTSIVSGLSGGTYTVNVGDANNCVTSKTVQIIPAVLLTTTFTYTNPATCITPDGSIFATVNGGSPGYNYTWTPSGVNTSSLINVVAGNYVLTVKDLAGCTYTFVASLNSVTGPTITVASSSLSCFGQCNATSTVTALGTAPLSYTWSSGATPTSSVATGLCSGLVTISVADGNGCIKSTTVNIATPTKLTASGIVSDVTCNSLSTGSINLTPTGGTTPYTYSWSPAGGAVQDPVNLPVGNYTCVTTDNNLCPTTNTFTVTQPATLTIAFNKKDVSCFGVCTGGVKTIISGGTSPYTYTWTPLGAFPGASTDTIGNLCTGIYSVNVTDKNGCAIAGTISIGQPTAALTATATSTNMTCNAICNGSGSVAVAGGSIPYTYTWTTVPATTTSTVGGLCVGNYSVTVKDVNGCTITNTIGITQPSAITITLTGTNPTCASACNGSVTSNVSGGTPGYTYSWTPTAASTSTLQNPTSLCGGNYSLIVTDNVGCIQQATVSLTDPLVLVANISFTNPLCNGSCNGIATATATGGNGGNIYNWQSPPPILTQTTQTISNLCPGIYTVTVTDINSCADTKTVSITNPIAITVIPAVTSASCGVSNGIIDASNVTGVGPFTYNWLPPVSAASATLSVVNGLPAGIYTVIVTSTSTGCSGTSTITLNNFNGPTGATISSTSVTCNGLCNGTATISNVVGGTPTYTLSWINPVSASASISNLCAGVYNAQVLDANNCLYFQSVTIAEPSLIIDNENISNAQCLGICNGSITLAPSGGVNGYTYAWSNSALTTSSLTNLCSGPLTATITDVSGCSIVSNYTISNITTITSNTLSTNNICFGDCNGSISINNISGGLAPYQVLWNDPAAQTNTLAIGLCNGNYSVSITDANGCVGVNSTSITSNSQVVVNNTLSQPNCNACNGSATLTPLGGGGTYTYIWSNTQTTNTVTNLCAGVYGVKITDNLGCITNTNIVINSSSGITGVTINKVDETCGLSCNGSATVVAIGGVLPITYNWVHNNSSSPTLTGLCAGTYFCNMTDANGCSLTASVVIGSLTTLTITSQVNPTSCSINSGSITVSVSGGTLPYTYNWLPAGNTATVSNLSAGIYTLIVTDASLCSKTQVYTINTTNGPVITSTIANASCSGIPSGSIAISISSGTPTYTILWSDGSSSGNITGLAPGNYSVSVTDNAGCKAVQGYSISVPSPIVFSSANLINPKCHDDCNGSITAVPSGGSLPFTYSWASSTSTVPSLSNLCPGTQTIIVTDVLGCIATQTYALTNPLALIVTPAITTASCGVSNGSIDATTVSGVGPFTYNWLPPVSVASSTLSIVNGLPAGIYTVIVTSTSTGCTGTNIITLNNTNGPTGATITSTSVTCNGLCNGTATISNVVGGTPTYTLSWVNPVSSSASVSNLCAGVYNAQVLDANNCLYFQSVTITEPPMIIDNEIITNAQCVGVCTGSIVLNPTSGTGGYSYTWSSSASTNSFVTNLCPGPLTATITDNSGCSVVSTYTILGITTVTCNTISANNICFGDCKGALSVNNIGGGLAPYSILWNDPIGQTNDTAIALCNGSYTVSVKDANGCMGINSGSITSNPQIVVNDTITQPNCNACNGSATITPTGGSGIFTYVWSNTQTTNPATSLCAGVYGVQITDNLGCISNTNVVVNSSSGITGALVNQADETCALSCNGSVTVAPIGGVAPITYNWVHNNSSSPIQSGLCAGNYYCNMVDSNGCSLTATVVIGSLSSLTITSQVYQSACSLNTGSITVSVSGGTAPYIYTWLPAGSTPTISNLSPGIYTLTVTDLNLCSKTQVYNVNSINGPIITSTIVNSSCLGACTGSIDIAISGGSPGYTTLWSDGSSGSNVSSLCPGNYSVAVTDIVGCVSVQGYSITNSPEIIFSSPNLSNPKCFNDCNGSITAVCSGGSLPFTYSWSPSTSTVPLSSNLCFGTHTVIITDIQGCIATQTYALTNPAALGYTASILSPTCSSAPNGSIGITPFGGTPSYSYSWTGGATSTLQNLLNIASGTYSLSMSDANGCKKDTFIVVTSTLVVNAIAGRDTTVCFGNYILDGSKSSGGANYDWMNLPSLSSISNSLVTTVNPSVGTSTYVLLAVNGVCMDSDTIQVTVNALPIVDAGPFYNVPIYVSALLGGTPTSPTGVSYTWTPNFGTLDNYNSANPIATNTVTTQYTVTVTDANGCTNFDTVTVSIYPHINISSGFTPNADGKNDVWLIDYLHEFPGNVVEIYNRWGELIFYSQGYAIPFDGKYKGKDLPVGTYYYVIDLHSDLFPIPYTGPLTIFR